MDSSDRTDSAERFPSWKRPWSDNKREASSKSSRGRSSRRTSLNSEGSGTEVSPRWSSRTSLNSEGSRTAANPRRSSRTSLNSERSRTAANPRWSSKTSLNSGGSRTAANPRRSSWMEINAGRSLGSNAQYRAKPVSSEEPPRANMLQEPLADFGKRESERGLKGLLPGKFFRDVLEMLPYKDVVRFRLVCGIFKGTADKVLIEGFYTERCGIMMLQGYLKRQLTQQYTMDPSSQLRISAQYYFLQFLLSELQVLQACCWRYVAKGQCPFSGGTILDEVHRLATLVKDNKIQQWTPKDGLGDTLFRINTEYMDYFEDSVEPSLHNGRVGMKIIDNLDCSLNSSSSVAVTYTSNYVLLNGCYIIWDGQSITKPPFPSATTGPTAADQQALCRYIRQTIRWNNMVHLLNKHLKDKKLTENAYNIELCEQLPMEYHPLGELPAQRQQYQKLLLKEVCSCLIEEKQMKESMRCDVDMECPLDHIPLRLANIQHVCKYHPHGDESDGAVKELAAVPNRPLEITETYSFNLQLKVEVPNCPCIRHMTDCSGNNSFRYTTSCSPAVEEKGPFDWVWCWGKKKDSGNKTSPVMPSMHIDVGPVRDGNTCTGTHARYRM